MKRKYFYVFGLVFSLLLASCNIGLGEAIDTESPEIEITSPNNGAVIRDKFAIKGTYSDDGQIKSIKLSLNNNETGIIKSYEADFADNSYIFTVDPLKEGLKDGKYEANITITDTYGHSTKASKTYIIDNTAPVIILSRPESKKGSESFEMFGQEFKLEGRAHDDNNVNIEIQIFSKDDEKNPLFIEKFNRLSLTIDETVLNAKEKLEDYEKVYGKISTDKNETKELYCKIIASDESKRYPVSESEVLPTDNEGNKIDTYYLESEFEEVIRASYSATDLYKMINGTFDASGRQVDETIKVEDIQKLLENNKVTHGQFSLNPANNPSYEVTNFNAPLNKDGKDFEGEDYKLTRGSSITVKVNSGLDGTYILGKSLGVYVSECDDEGKILDKENKIWLIEPEIDEDGNTRELTEEQIAIRKAALETQMSVEKSKSYTFKSVELKASRNGMMLGKKYLIFVSGYDTNKTKVSNFNKDYGFYFAPKDAAPTLTVTEPSANTTYLAKGATLKVSGTSKTEMGNPTIEILVNGKEVKKIEKALEITENEDLSNISKFEYEIPASAFDQKTSNEYLVSIVAKLEGKETVKEKTVSYDVDSPEILIQSVTPGIEKENVEYLNKTSLIKGSINDSFTGLQTNTLKYYVLQEEEEKLSGVITMPSNFTVEIDTEKLTDEKEMILKLYAEDKAGNVSEITETYFVDQSTDIPNVGPNDESWDAQIDSEEKLQESIVAGNKNNIFTSGGSIVFNIVDDDGISVVTVNDKDYELNGSPLETSVSYVLPTSSGRNKLDVTVKDIFDVEKKLTVWVQVTGAAPKVTLRASPEYFSRNTNKVPGTPDKITISGVNEGADPFKIEVLGEKTDYSSDVITGSDDKNVNWTHSFVPKSKDINKIKYKVSDYWGIFTETEISFKEDSENPVVEMPDSNMPTVAATEASSFKFKGTSSDVGSVVEKVQVSFDGEIWQDAVGTNEWSYTSIFAEEKGFETEGEKTIHVRNFDTAGNYSDVVTKDFVFDKAEPVVAIQKYDNNEISTTQISVQDEFTLSGSATDAYGLESVILEQTKGEASREVPVTFKNGSWTTEKLPIRDANAEIESGTYVYTVKATDKAGKVSSSTLSVLIDKEGPKVEIVTPDASYLGTAAIDKVTFTFAGRAIEEIGQSGVASYSYAIVGQGEPASNWIEVPSTAENWSFTKNIPTGEEPLAEGKYTLYVKAKDKAGNESAVASRNFDVDLAAPSVEVSLSSGTRATTEYFDSSFNLVGTIADSNGIASVVVKINGEKTPIVKETPNSTSYSLNKEITVSETDGIIKADGTYNFEVTITDKVGKTTTKTLSAIVDTKAPTVEFKSHANGNIVTTIPFVIEGTVSDAGSGISTEGGTFVLKQGETEIQSGALTVQANGMWTQEIGKDDTGSLMTTEGDYAIQVSLNDNAGKTSTQTVNVVYDKALPQLSVTSGNSVTTNGNVVISGKSWDTYGLKENGSVVITLKDANANIVRSFTPEVAKTTSEPTDNNWEETIEVGEGKSIETDGKYTVEIKAVDKVGKESVIKTINVDVDTTKPIVGSSIIVPTSTQTEGTSFKFNGISSDGEGTGVEKVEISFDEETWVEAVGTSVWTYTSIFSEEKTFEKDGAKTIYVRATDGAGNESEVRSGMFVFDSSRPEGKIKNEEGVEITGKSFFVGGEFTLNVDAKDKYSVSKIELTQTKDGEDLKTYTQEVEGEEVTTAISRLPLRTYGTEIETGNYEYKVVVTDKVGKTAEITTTIVIDKRAPKVEITSPDSSYVGISAIAKDVFTFAGTAEEESYESGVESYSYVLTQTDGIPTTGWTTTTSGTNWSFTKEIGNDAGKLSEGSWTLYVKARDKAGNETAEADYAKVSFDVDKGNPVANISLNPISETNTYNETFKVEGKLYDTNGVSKVKVSILNAKDNSEVVSWEKDGIEAKSQPTNNNLSEEITIGTNGKITSDGNYIIEVTVTDNVGKEVTERRSITVDRKGPTVEFKSHEDGNIITTYPITVEGTASDEGSGVNTEEGVFKLIQGSTTVESGKLNIQANGIWNGSIVGKNLTEGEYKLQVTIKDKAGYDDTSEVTVKYDKALPQLIVTEPSGNSVITNGNVVISGKSWDTYGLKENGSVVITLKDANANIVRSFTPEVAKTTSEPTDNNWEETIEVGEGKSIETDGKYTVEIKVVDKVGKESLSQVYELTIDRVNPEIDTSIVDETKVNDSNKGSDGTNTVYKLTQIPIKVLASDEASGLMNVTYSLKPNDNSSYNALVLKNGEWTGYVTCDWQGTQKISVKAEDKAGNDLTKEIPVTIDTIAPNTISSSIEGTRLENGTRNVQVEISATDAGNTEGTEPYNSGVASVEIVKIGSQRVSIPGTWDKTNKKGTLDITSDKISTGGVTVKVTDNANNSVENTIFTFQLDKTNPTVSITGLSDADSSTAGTQINGTVTLTGTSNDDQGLAEITPVKLYYSKDGGETYTPMAAVEGTTSWSLDIDTTTAFGSIEDGKSVTLKVEAVDKAGNTNSTTTTVIVDQDTDRPIINLSNLDYIEGMTFEEMTSSNPVWHKQKYLFGSVTDDDGTIKELFVSTDGTNWGENVYKNGSWSYTFSDDGDKTLYFKVIDANGTGFISNGTTKPKLSDGTTTNSTDSNLYLKVDTTQPTIPVVRFSTSSSPAMDIPEGLTGEDLETWASRNGWQDIDELTVTTLGGPESVLYVMYNAYDANGIYSTKVKCAETEAIEENITDVLNTATDIVKIVKFDTSARAIDDTKANKLVIEARDNATGTATIGAVEKNYSLRVDNTAPTVRFSRIDDMLYGSIATEIEGSTNDANTVEEVYFGVSKDDSTAPTKYLPLHEEKESNISWKVSFSGSADEATDEKYRTQLLNTYLGRIFDDVYVNDVLQDVEKGVYFWVYAVDSNNNESEPTKKKVLVSTMGDKPRVNVSFPTVNDKTGGSIRITGESEIQASELDSVWIQIDPSYEGTFNEGWKTELEGLISGKEVGYSITEEPKYTNESGTEITIEDLGPAIKAFGNPQSWNLQINTLKEFETTGDDVNICIRVYAVGKTGKVSEPVLVPFIIDPQSPRIGNTTPLQLVQYASDETTIKARMNYEPGMWISGTWYLTGSVEDESGIYLISFGEESLLGTEKVVEGDSSKREVIEVESTSEYKNYLLKVPVGNDTTNAFGQLNYTLTVIEGASDRKSATQSIILNYDNKAPEFEAELDAKENRIYQSNGTYSVSGTFDEAGSGINNQSGFNRIAMYFTRTYDETKYIVDPMIENGEDGDDNRYPETEFTYLKGIYWRKINGNISNGQVPTNSLSNVRVGGLCMINEVIYKIKSIDSIGNATLDKPIVDQTVDIYFALAQVIDNMTVESGTTEAYDSTKQDSHINGDGDQMIEGVRQNGTKYNWTSSIDSSLIYDGPITINFVAFDAAGNSVTKTYSGTVSNNAPRIAGVSFGTDNNGDGSVANDEMITSYSGWYDKDSENKQTGITENGKKANGENVYSFDVTGLVLNVKGDVKVLPEIVGGNTGLGYKVLYGETEIKSGDYDENKVGHSTDGEIRDVEDLEINLTVEDFLSKNIPDGQKDYTFSIIDKTQGMTIGQAANIKIPMNVMLSDTISPAVTINPFYWEGKDKNSLYQNSRENGHIELEGDLPDTFIPNNQNDSIMDRDPKVSGKITIEGTANDNVLLMELGVKTNTEFGETVKFNSGSYTAIAKRVGGEWLSQGTLTANGWQFEVKEETNTQEGGNTLKWKLHLDTQKVSTTAFADFTLQLQAIDRGSADLVNGVVKYAYETNSNGNKSQVDSTQTQAGALTNFYKMDIVPYITDVKTMLWGKKKLNQSVYSRTAKGHYPIASDETITLIGFNLSKTHYAANNTTDYRTTKAVAASGLTTNEYNEPIVTYTVGNKEVLLSALNNKNANEAVGTKTNATLEDQYNMQPNSETNDTLTDDIFFDVWEFDKKAAIAKQGVVKEPIMHINPTNNMIGFAFVNGPAFFSMPNGSSNSYTIWQKNHADYSNINFVYDSEGNTHSLSTGLDTQPTDEIGGRLQYIDSRWGGNGEWVYNWNTERTVALDSICVKNGTYVNGKNLTETIIDMKRFSSPSIAVAGNRVYIAYFDRFNEQIRFVCGLTNQNRGQVGGQFADTTTDSGTITNDNSNGGTTYGNHDGFESANTRYSVIAGVEYPKTKPAGENNTGAMDTENKAGKHLSLSVIPGTNQDGDIVVIVWYDENQLYYVYRKGAKTDIDAHKNGVKDNNNNILWSTPIPVFNEGIGENCKITTDATGGIHIAAYDRNNADLHYAYLSSYDANPTTLKTCLVDSYSQVGKNISIDVAKISATGKVVPYISYFANGFNNLPKVAYLPEGIDAGTELKPGADSSTDLFTGNWEVSLIPTTSYVCEDNINVAIWKDTNGTIKKSVTGTAVEGDTGTCYGNGKSQFVLGYATEEGVNGYIETAQLK